MPDQLPLPLPPVRRPVRGPILSAPSNADAMAWLRETSSWPLGRLALWGGGGVGKSHALHLWAGREGAAVLDGSRLCTVPGVRSPIAIDDADRASDDAVLLHLLNRAADAGYAVLLAGRLPPSRWVAVLPDLQSRLRATTAVQFGAAEDTLLRALLARLLKARQLQVPEPVQDWLLERLPRTAEAVRQAVSMLDDAAAWHGGVTRAAAAEVAAALHEREADDSPETTPAALSPCAAALL